MIGVLKKVFNRDIGIEYLKSKKPDLFRVKTKNGYKELKTFKGSLNQLYEEISIFSNQDLITFTRDFSLNNQKGKYYEIHRDNKYYINLIKENLTTKKDSPCNQQDFSEQIVKPFIRQYIKDKSQENIEELVTKELLPILIKHVKERTYQQVKADYSEYLILMNCQNIMPTLTHKAGTDMYLLNEKNEFEDLNIKTTRSIWDIKEPKDAITKLYEKQGKFRFESCPRTYIYLSDNIINDNNTINKNKIKKQLIKKYDINFNYKNKEYQVKGCRFIQI
tara:strand:- start:2166 stop:2996 length:831 start_codon:yes stop_codon:yes gene_type:complete